MHRKLIVILLAAGFILSRPTAVRAEDFQKNYIVDYYLSENKGNISTRVAINLKLTNLRSNVIIKTFSLSFPKSFTVTDLATNLNGAPAAAQIIRSEKEIQVKINLDNPEGGQGATNTLTIAFNQDNLFKVNGNVWEVILPTIDAQDRSSYEARVHMPVTTNKKVSVAKPVPDNITDGVIIWNNPKTKTIYAVFGDRQIYSTRAVYHLNNPKLAPVYTDIALIPDTAYQKTYIQSLAPTPSYVYQDADGNLMARYTIRPKAGYDVVYTATVEEYVKPRDETRTAIKEQFEMEKSFIYNTGGFWTSNGGKQFSTIEDVYTYTTDTFSYNYDRVVARVDRLGAQKAISNPENAVCTEFTDVFVSLARNSGLPAREIQGYGFSNDPQLQPLSSDSDILHAWPEYYDRQQGLWIPVDPTWENTSGIDYFHSFDLNHITFVIHGKDSQLPYPAGTYKLSESKDVMIRAVSTIPKTDVSYIVSDLAGPKRIHPGSSYHGSITLQNSGNTYGWNTLVTFSSGNFKINPTTIRIASLAPYERKTVSFEYTPAGYRGKGNDLAVSVNGQSMADFELTVIPVVFDIGLAAGGSIIVIASLYWLIRSRSRRNPRYNI